MRHNDDLDGRNLARDPIKGWEFQGTYTLSLAVSLFLLESTQVPEMPELGICGVGAGLSRLVLEKDADVALEWTGCSGIHRTMIIECKYRQDGLMAADFLEAVEQLLLLRESHPYTDLLVVSNHAHSSLRRRFRSSRLPGHNRNVITALSSALAERRGNRSNTQVLLDGIPSCYWYLDHSALDIFLTRTLGKIFPSRTGPEIESMQNDLKAKVKHAMEAESPAARIVDADVFQRWVASLPSFRAESRVFVAHGGRHYRWISKEMQYQQCLGDAILLIWQRRYRAGLLELKDLGALARPEVLQAKTQPVGILAALDTLARIEPHALPEDAQRQAALTALDQLVSLLNWLFTEAIPASGEALVAYDARFEQFERLAVQILSPNVVSASDVALVEAWRQTLAISHEDYSETAQRIRQIYDDLVFTYAAHYDEKVIVASLDKLSPLISAYDWSSLQRAMTGDLVPLPYTLSRFLDLIASRMVRVGDLVLQRRYVEATNLLVSAAQGLQRSEFRNQHFHRSLLGAVMAKAKTYSALGNDPRLTTTIARISARDDP